MAVVIACFNDGHFLEEALRSVAAQEQCELVIVDDGSTDPATLELLAALREAGTLVVTQPNAGLAAARMTGVAATKAPYVHPLDADDRLAPAALETLADRLDSHPDVAAAWGSYRTFGASDCHFPAAPSLDPWRITYLDEIPGTSMVRREAIEAIGGWDSGIGYEDWDFWMKLARLGARGIGLEQVTLLYRTHDSPRLLSETLRAHATHFGVLRERNLDLFKARRRNRRASATPRPLKVALPAIDAIPGLPERRKGQLWAMARYFFQRDMCSDCYRGPLERLHDAARHRFRANPNRPAV